MNNFRIEHDSMGELQVPADALWGAQTQRAVENFPVSGRPMPRDFIRALGLVKAAAAQLSALPRTTVYLDAGDADWLPVDKAAALLVHAGVQYTRGFALGATHYSSASGNVTYAAAVEQALAAKGYPGKRAVLDTADNGRPFTWTYWHAHKKTMGSDFDNATVCRSTAPTHPCVTLGHAPTWQVGNAAPYVDAYLWFGRPWLIRQASPYSQSRALWAARTTPYDQRNLTGGLPTPVPTDPTSTLPLVRARGMPSPNSG